MYCEKCGAKIPEDAEFCTNCGARLKKEKELKEETSDTEIQLIIKPTYKMGYMLLSFIVTTAILILIAWVMFFITNSKNVITVFTVLEIIFVILAIIVRINYNYISYVLYKKKIVYKNNFMYLMEKDINYKDVREVTMKQSFIQKFFNIGNIVIFTSAESGMSNGIEIINVENVEDVYKEIKSIINI